MIIQQDWASPNYTCAVSDLLDAELQNSGIGTDGPTSCPARSSEYHVMWYFTEEID